MTADPSSPSIDFLSSPIRLKGNSLKIEEEEKKRNLLHHDGRSHGGGGGIYQTPSSSSIPGISRINTSCVSTSTGFLLRPLCVAIGSGRRKLIRLIAARAPVIAAFESLPAAQTNRHVPDRQSANSKTQIIIKKNRLLSFFLCLFCFRPLPCIVLWRIRDDVTIGLANDGDCCVHGSSSR